MNVYEKFKDITAIVLDVDGVLTDGKIGYGNGSDEETKFFHVRDGHAIVLARRANIKVGILSGRASDANYQRALDLQMDFMYQGKKDKAEAFEILLDEQRLEPEEVMYIGDDIVDIPPFKRAGLSICVADAPDYIDEYVHMRTKATGGNGAVREVIEQLLKAQGVWDKLMERYTQ